jgi:hypothetical protein
MRRLLVHLRRNAVAYIALFVALGGGGSAAVQQLVPRNSVGTRQVIDHSLLRRDFKQGQLPRGPRGAPGPTGPPGPSGVGPDTSAFYTKSQSDARFLPIGGKAADADTLDGLDSRAFTRTYLAQVESDGTLLLATGFASSMRTKTGVYELRLSQPPPPTLRCTTLASLAAGTLPIGEISASGPAGDGTFVDVWITNGAGAYADRRFQVVVVC